LDALQSPFLLEDCPKRTGNFEAECTWDISLMLNLLWTAFKILLEFSNRSVFRADLGWLEFKELFSSVWSMPLGLGHTPWLSMDTSDLTAGIRPVLLQWTVTSERMAIGFGLSILSFRRAACLGVW